jgi:hypothetical protein
MIYNNIIIILNIKLKKHLILSKKMIHKKIQKMIMISILLFKIKNIKEIKNN